MYKKTDNLDELIRQSNICVKASEDYNSKLLMKLDYSKKDSYIREKYRTMGLSFIMSGLFMFLVYTSNISYTLATMQYKLKSNISIMENRNNYIDIMKIITRERF